MATTWNADAAQLLLQLETLMHVLAKVAIAAGGYAAWLGLRLLVLKRATRRLRDGRAAVAR